MVDTVQTGVAAQEQAVPRGRKRDEEIDREVLRIVLAADEKFGGRLVLNGSQIAAIMDRTPSTLKPRLDYLADAGLLLRVVAGWAITDAGRAVIAGSH